MIEREAILGVVLAGGSARRLGGAGKAGVCVAGRPLIAHVVDRAAPQVAGLVINASDEDADLAGLGLPLVPDAPDERGQGPLAGLMAGLRHAAGRDGIDAVASFAVDTPFPPADLVARLAAALDGRRADYAIAACAGVPYPVFGLWPVGLLTTLERLYAEGLRAPRLLDGPLVKAVAALADRPFDPFVNANTPQDVARLEQLADRPDGGDPPAPNRRRGP